MTLVMCASWNQQKLDVKDCARLAIWKEIMVLNQIESFKRRGLSEIVGKWNGLVHQGLPNIRNPLIADKGKEVIPVVYSSVEGYFRSENNDFDGKDILILLKELKSLPDSELQEYVSKVEIFIIELNHAKSLS